MKYELNKQSKFRLLYGDKHAYKQHKAGLWEWGDTKSDKEGCREGVNIAFLLYFGVTYWWVPGITKINWQIYNLLSNMEVLLS